MQFLPILNCERIAVGICVHRGRDGTGKELQCWTLPLYGCVQGNPFRPFAAPPGRLQKPVPHPGWDGEYTCLFRCFQVQLGSKISECIDSTLLLTLPAQVFWKPPTTERGACNSIFSLLLLWAVKTVSTWTSGSLRAELVMQTCSNSQDKTKKVC